jgi:hypothetical protein
MVLPGAQALLGFQLAIMVLEGFDQLPPASQRVHLASLALMVLSTILLMAPAAYHRLVEQARRRNTFIGSPVAWCSRPWCRWPWDWRGIGVLSCTR